MLRAVLPLILATNVLGVALPELQKRADSVWNLDNFDSLITFGDSYTDENRLSYIIAHNGSLPPAGTYFPEGLNTASGGRTWPRFVVQYTGHDTASGWQPGLDLYDYAVSGAVCSNNITPRILAAIHEDFPAVIEYEVPAFLADRGTVRNGTDQTYFATALSATNAVYSLWIGTNDLGVGAFLTDSQILGNTLTDYTDCVFRVFDELYANGGRVFVLFSNAPLQLTPLYANESLVGTGDNQYWNPKPTNHTQIAETMTEEVATTNAIFKYQTPFELLIAGRYPGASIAIFNVYQLLYDIYTHPTEYLNGTQPANVTGYEHHCSTSGTNCTLEYDGTSSDSFMFYDELHPSEQTDRVIARNFVQVLNGSSSYATYYSSP